MCVEAVWVAVGTAPIHRAVLNVVSNALDAASEREEGGEVAVKSEFQEEAGVVQVLVRDNGPGIFPDQMGQLFRPLVSSKRGRGTGLGLPVSQKILTEHGGRILVDSTPGRGSCFTLELPAVVAEKKPDTVNGKCRMTN
ncbi:unnamed protein product, partial [marine sediment metagenome]